MKKSKERKIVKVVKLTKKQKLNKDILLREYRESIGLTQSELGKLVGVNARTISAYELGTRKPSTKVAVKLLKVFNIKLQDLFPTI